MCPWNAVTCDMQFYTCGRQHFLLIGNDFLKRLLEPCCINFIFILLIDYSCKSIDYLSYFYFNFRFQIVIDLISIFYHLSSLSCSSSFNSRARRLRESEYGRRDCALSGIVSFILVFFLAGSTFGIVSACLITRHIKRLVLLCHVHLFHLLKKNHFIKLIFQLIIFHTVLIFVLI